MGFFVFVCFYLLLFYYSFYLRLDSLNISYINLWKSSQFEVCHLISPITYCATIKLSRTEWKGVIFEVFTTFFHKTCFAIGLIARGSWCYTHYVIIMLGMVCVATYIYEGACVVEEAIFRLSQTCWKSNTYIIGFNTCVGRLCDLDALFSDN